MSAQSKLKKSRESWKSKASQRADDNRYLRKELARVKKERDRRHQEAKEARAKLKHRASRDKSPAVGAKVDVVFIALQLFLLARLGFRAVSRVFGVVGHYLGVAKAPCPQTIINWVARLSISRIQYTPREVGTAVRGDRFANGFIWMIDISIALGAGKILAVLALNAHHHRLNAGAPCLQEVRCVAVSVANSWTGETIADWLQRVIGVLGRPVSFLKDGGTDLGKAVRLLGERGFASPSIEDLSHRIANLLKQAYAEHPLFATFLSACGKASRKLKQTLLACLAPPKVSSKARFMNLHRLALWAERLLKHSPVGRAARGSLLEKLRASLDRLPVCKALIGRFLRDANPLLACQKLLKAKGLSHETQRTCQALIETIPPSSPVRIGFTHWMQEQLKIAETLGLADIGLPISSDPIESLFGVAKRQGASEIKDANRIAARLPAFCGPVTVQDAQRVLDISVAQQQQAVGSLPSLIQQRREILPNPGCLENATLGEVDQNLDLIPEAKNRSKDSIIVDISEYYKKCSGPLMCLQT